jgi:glycosyltransferase involved in cell wall biosynthesis
MRLLGVLAQRGHDIESLVLYHGWPSGETGAAAFAAQARSPLSVWDAGWRPGYRGAADKVGALALFRAGFAGLLRRARAFAPDVVYSSQQLWDCAAASHIARRLRRPHVIHLHYVVGPWLQTGFSGSPRLLLAAMGVLGLDRPLDRLLSCDHVIAVSDFIRGEALRHGVPPGRVTAIRNTMPLPPPTGGGEREAVRRELGLTPDCPVVGIVGRLDPDKGHFDTLKAFAEIAPRFPRAHLVMVGEGPLRGDLMAWAEEHGLKGRLTLTGQRPDVPRLLAAMDVFSHPSRREPFGLALLEASAAALPVVAYAEGGALEIVIPGETGLLAAPGDVSDLAAALTHLLSDPALGTALGAAGRLRVAECFRPESASAAFARVLRQVACHD